MPSDAQKHATGHTQADRDVGPKTTYDVFLSHASADKPSVERLARRLREDGLNPFLDKWHLVPGEPWQEALEKSLAASLTCAVFVGQGEGPWQNMEMRTALSRRARDRTIRVIPVLLPGAPDLEELPPFLEQFTVVDFRGGTDDEDAYHRLVCGIHGEFPGDGQPGDRQRPQPVYESAETRELSRVLKAAYRQRAELKTRGEDTTETTETILNLRRKIREGGQLKAGDSLLDGRFELIEPIGKGGFAQVWKAYDEKERKLVAVKVLHGQYAQDRTRRERFFRGSRHMAELRHPGIVQVIEKECEDGGYHFFVMEYESGGDYRQAVLLGRLTVEERIRIILDLGEALSFAHARGVIHRDVKPANILLDATGRPKLTDFDLVRAAESTGGTRTTTGLGSFVYAAPEAMFDAKEATEQADVYGLGMTAIFALHGIDLPAQVIRNPVDFVASLEVDERWRKAVQRAVAWEVDDRWRTTDDFCKALKEGLQEDISQGQIVTPGQRIVRMQVGQRIWTHPLIEIDFVYIEPGEFWMGSPESEKGRSSHEKRHRVELTRGYWMAKMEVTHRLFMKFVRARYITETGQKYGSQWLSKRSPDHPIIDISWNDAVKFCEWLSGEVEDEIRLPTEAEWEYAARAGSETATYAPNLGDIAWFMGNSNGTKHPVGTKDPNAWGLYDMLGNVWEWVADLYGEYPKGDVVDPRGPEQGTHRVRRGGSYNIIEHNVRAAARRHSPPRVYDRALGFRLARG